MRLVAQRVLSPKGLQGINAFCYLHGPIVWLELPPSEVTAAPGHLANAVVEVRPPGNRVRSYLDILTPDRTLNQQVETDIIDCIDLFTNPAFPLKVHHGETTFQFDIELALAPGWHRELVVLLHRSLAVRV
jgi:hypothetical protein